MVQRVERAADGGVVDVSGALTVSRRAPRIKAQRGARGDPYNTRNYLPPKKLRREIHIVSSRRRGSPCRQTRTLAKRGEAVKRTGDRTAFSEVTASRTLKVRGGIISQANSYLGGFCSSQ